MSIDLDATGLPGWIPAVSLGLGGYGALGLGLGLAYGHEAIHEILKTRIVPGILSRIDKNYDEAIARTYRDKSLEWLRKTIMFLMYCSLLHLLVYKFVFKGYNNRFHDFALAVSVLYTGVFEYRLKKAFDPYETNFGVMGRNFYKFYPLLDEHDCMIRSVKLDESHSLKQKWNLMVDARLVDLLFSTGYHALILIPWLQYNFNNDMLQLLPLLLSGLYLTLATTFESSAQTISRILELILELFGLKSIQTDSQEIKLNLSPIHWVDCLQRYLAVLILKKPVVSISTPSYWAPRTKWEGQTSIPVAHFNHLLLHNKPWSQFLISEVYNPARKAGNSIGYSMAKFVLARAVAFIGLVVLFHNSNRPVLVTKVVIALWINYLGHASFRYVEQDGKIALFAKRDYRRHDDVRNFAFVVYRLAALAFDYVFFTLPMIALVFSKNQ